MAAKLKWKVVREHEGDRFYRVGEIREGTKAELGHLEGKVLVLVDETAETAAAKAAADKKAADDAAAAKAEPSPLNKAEGASPANKAASSRTSKD